MVASPNEQPKVIRFVRRQVRQIREGGTAVVLSKVRALLFVLVFPLSLPLTLPVVLAIRLLRPLVLIRFGHLTSSRIGHFAENTDIYLCERDAGLHPRRSIDFFFHGKPVSNSQLQKMWERTPGLRIVQITSLLDRVNRLLPTPAPHVVPLHSSGETIGLLKRFPPNLAFTEAEKRCGELALRGMGIPEEAPFICFHARDPVYLDAMFGAGKWDYHDYRDSTVGNYVPVMEELARLGYWAIRMGAIVKDPLPTQNPRIIDYATNGSRTDFLDIYLGAQSAFFVSSGSGIDAIPMIFRRPTMFVNLVPIEGGRFWDPEHLFIPKGHWLRDEHRFLTFREILSSGAGKFMQTAQFDQLGIELIENTPEEIAGVVLEMEQRQKGTWQTTEEDEELQCRFWALFRPSELNRVFVARIGTEFLRQHHDLLD